MNPRKIHIVGIEGAGTSALARLYHRQGCDVSGSDDGDHFYAGVVAADGIPVSDSFDPAHVPDDADLVVYSTAFADNPEVARGRELGIETIPYADALSREFNGAMGVAVIGTHGKTTTTGLLAEALAGAGLDPTAVVGGRVIGWDGNFRGGSGKYFVLEADEYQNKLRYYSPTAVILTSVDWDHPDFFPDFDTYRDAFTDFVRRIPRHGILVYWNDSAVVREIADAASCTKIGYGALPDAEYQMTEYEPVSGEPDAEVRQRFSILSGFEKHGPFDMRLAGRHNALNATAVVALCDRLGVDHEAVRGALARYRGVERRFQFTGRYRGALVFDDYAHHPEEIRATIEAFRDLYPDKRLIAVFHPHTYSRTAALLSEFSQSFDGADSVIVLDIYGSAREKAGGTSSSELVREINRYEPGKARHVPGIDEVVADLRDSTGEGDLVVTFGAGDVWKAGKRLCEKRSS